MWNKIKRLFKRKSYIERELAIYKRLYHDQSIMFKRYQNIYHYVRNHNSLHFVVGGASMVHIDTNVLDNMVISEFTEDELKDVEWILNDK